MRKRKIISIVIFAVFAQFFLIVIIIGVLIIGFSQPRYYEKAGWKVYQIPYNKAYKQEVRQSLLKLIKEEPWLEENCSLVRDYLYELVYGCNVDDSMTIGELCELFADKNIGGVPVVKNDAVVGIITERDILRAVKRL